MKAEILRFLRESSEYVSGQELCGKFGVSRTAVWKVVNQLKDEGYEITAVQNRGYLLQKTPNLLSGNELKSRIDTKWAGKNLHYYEELTSTNVVARQCIEEGEANGTLVVAEKQTEGRGRRGRKWESPAKMAVYMTIGLKPNFAPEKAAMLNLVMGLSIAEAVEESTGLAAGIKWPNDLVAGGRKICGILTEMNIEPDYVQSVVIGAGINVNQREFPKELADKATSLFLETGTEISRAELVQKSMEHFEKNYECFLKTLDLSALREAYEKRLVNKDSQVRILDPQGEYEGTALGITNTGELLVRRKDGSVEEVYAGEVSVRGYYGYV